MMTDNHRHPSSFADTRRRGKHTGPGLPFSCPWPGTDSGQRGRLDMASGRLRLFLGLTSPARATRRKLDQCSSGPCRGRLGDLNHWNGLRQFSIKLRSKVEVLHE